MPARAGEPGRWSGSAATPGGGPTHFGDEEGITLFLVSGRPTGLSVEPLKTMDMTRRWYQLQFDGVDVPDDAVMGAPDQGWPALKRTLEWGAAALCAEMVGGAQWVLDTSVDYAKTRQQFGKPIGSFQAMKHMCADMLVRVESARSASYWAAWAASVDDDDLLTAASLAKAWCSEAFFRNAADNIQIHGGIGFTWEHDAHRYFRRARASASLFGDAPQHRDAIAKRIGL